MKPKRKMLRFREFVNLQNRKTKNVSTEAGAGFDDPSRKDNLPSEIRMEDQKMLEKRLLGTSRNKFAS